MMQTNTNGVLSIARLNRIDVKVYPNPSSYSNVMIEFTVPQDDRIILEIYTLMGKHVGRLFDAPVEKGIRNSVQIKRHELAAGTYLYRLQTSNGMQQGKMVLLE